MVLTCDHRVFAFLGDPDPKLVTPTHPCDPSRNRAARDRDRVRDQR